MGIPELKYIESVPAILQQSGISLKQKYFKEIIDISPEIGFLKIDIEKCLNEGVILHVLERIKDKYLFSFHSNNLLLSSNQGTLNDKLIKLKILAEKFNLLNISMSATWSVLKGIPAVDFLPFPYNEKNLNIISDNVMRIQDYLSRQILIENPMSYFEFKGNISEPEFFMRMVERTGCSLLLNLNNIYANSINHNFNPKNYVDIISDNIIKEIHISGHTKAKVNGKEKIIDISNNKISKEVWELYSYTILEKGCIPTLVKWDYNLPEFSELLAEVNKCNEILKLNSYRNAA
ncbi:DUF692 domain-containing protein [Candidatus Jidaibacter acanthamoebae]|nr:DUF692 family multinuclear iron-containing protein [Candidatus Jidaibacter acanthamoeba]